MKSKKPLILFGVLLVLAGIVGIAIMQSARQPASTMLGRQVAPQTENAQATNAEPSTASLYVPFTAQDYEKAKSEGKIIMLNFYANWCPICRAEAPELAAAFAELNDPRVIGFRVNFKDSETDKTEKALAEELNIPYQHTKVFFKNGQEVARYPNQWTRQDALTAIKKELN